MLSDNDLELLSAYLDGALNNSERAALEMRLSTDADLRRELARLRATVDLVKGLPTLAAPRDFTLTPRMVRRPPTILTSAAFSALSAAAAVVLLVVGAALFTNSARPPVNNFAGNQVAVVLTIASTNVQDGLQAGADESAEAVARQLEDEAGTQSTLADMMPSIVLSTQQAQGFASEVQPDLQLIAPTGMLETMMYASAPESATLAEEGDDFADTTASDAAAANQQNPQDGEGQLALEQAAPTDQSQASEPSQPPASIASGAGAVQPMPGETDLQPPVAAFATASPAPTLAPTEKPSATPTPTETLTPTTLPTSTATPSLTWTLVPSPTATATPLRGVFSEPGSAGIGISLIVVALLLFGAAVVTTILRRRA